MTDSKKNGEVYLHELNISMNLTAIIILFFLVSYYLVLCGLIRDFELLFRVCIYLLSMFALGTVIGYTYSEKIMNLEKEILKENITSPIPSDTSKFQKFYIFSIVPTIIISFMALWVFHSYVSILSINTIQIIVLGCGYGLMYLFGNFLGLVFKIKLLLAKRKYYI
ncbi:hypothetical protein [Methanotorris igneus]|uniref:hypothetical protein n=1 Tax=Methanotorris igneus TaxID=2189 RepID=UPI00064F58F3|nr:hypothetical protein [Methanotorris igneus]